MKKTILYIGIAAMTLTGFTSCNDYLDMPSKEKFDSETVFEDVNKAEMAVIGCYPQTFNREFFYQLGMGTDECISTESQSNSKIRLLTMSIHRRMLLQDFTTRCTRALSIPTSA